MKNKQNSSDRFYTQAMIKASAPWHTFAGRVYLAGLQLGLSAKNINEYMFETYHGMDLKEEVPATMQDVLEDIALYFEIE